MKGKDLLGATVMQSLAVLSFPICNVRELDVSDSFHGTVRQHFWPQKPVGDGLVQRKFQNHHTMADEGEVPSWLTERCMCHSQIRVVEKEEIAKEKLFSNITLYLC